MLIAGWIVIACKITDAPETAYDWRDEYETSAEGIDDRQRSPFRAPVVPGSSSADSR